MNNDVALMLLCNLRWCTVWGVTFVTVASSLAAKCLRCCHLVGVFFFFFKEYLTEHTTVFDKTFQDFFLYPEVLFCHELNIKPNPKTKQKNQ